MRASHPCSGVAGGTPESVRRRLSSASERCSVSADCRDTHPITRLARVRIEAGIAMPSAAAAFLFTTRCSGVRICGPPGPGLAAS